MRQPFYYKMRQKFITKCVRFVITKCDSYYKMQRFYYKMLQLYQNEMQRLLQIATVQYRYIQVMMDFFNYPVMKTKLSLKILAPFHRIKK